MADVNITELKASLQSLQKDVDSKAATIKHLQNALDAKTMTIGILSKANKGKSEGRDLESYIAEYAEEQCKAKLADKEKEVHRLQEKVRILEQKPQTSDDSVALEEEVAQLHAELDKANQTLEQAETAVAQRKLLEDELDRLQKEVLEQSSKADEASQQLTQLRDYQAKAFELKLANDAMSGQLEAVNEEMQQMQIDHQQELEELQKELSQLQGDREEHRRAVAEQIDTKVKQMRSSAEGEKEDLLARLQEEKERHHTQLQEISAERDRLRLQCDAQELELRGLREAIGDGESKEEEHKEDHQAKAERIRSLREQSQFAFDEMSRRIQEVREEGEIERKRMAADLEQQLKQRGAEAMEMMNARDSLQTQVEVLEQSNKALGAQRDELSRQIREKDRNIEGLQTDLEAQQEAQRTQQQRFGVLTLVHALQHSAVLPAFSLLRRSIGSTNFEAEALEAENFAGVDDLSTCSASVDGSTAVGEVDMDVIEEEGDDISEEEEQEDMYGMDDKGQEEWRDMMRLNTFEALFTGAETVVSNTATATGDLKEHISNIVTSLDFFPQMYASVLQVLDRAGQGMGKELRKFMGAMQRVLGRSMRIASVIEELCANNQDVCANLKNLVRVKSLEWHMRHLKTAGQSEVLIRLQQKSISKLKEDMEDMLDQYGDECAQKNELQQKGEEMQKELEASKKLIEELRAAQAPKPAQDVEDQKAEAIADASDAAPPAKAAKGKGKKGPGPPPPPSGKAAPEEAEATAEASADASDAAPPAKAAKGKGKKGPGPPPPPSGKAAPEAADSTAEAPADASDAAPPAKAAKGKGKKGPPPPPPSGKAGAAADAPAEAAADAPATGKGGKGPPPPKGGGKGAPPGKAAPGAKAPAGKAAGKGKSALPEVDPGPPPPKDMVPKKFHWTNVVGNRFATSMFATIVEDLNTAAKPAGEGEAGEPVPVPKSLRLKFDKDRLTEAFFKKKEEDKPGGQEQAQETKKKTKATCLDGKKSQAVEIFLNGCGVNIDHVRGSVLDLDEKAITPENLGKVIEFIPQGEELGELKEFRQNNDPKVLPWGRAEEFLIHIMDMPNFKVRAECIVSKGMFTVEFEEVSGDVGTLRSCLCSVVNSTALPSIFALVMQVGNYLNHGSNKGAQRGFTLDTLPLLNRVEGFEDKTYSLIRFIMETLESDRKVKDGAMEDLKLCDASSKLDFEEAVRRLGELEKKVKAIESAVEPVPAEDGKERKDSVDIDFEQGKITVNGKDTSPGPSAMGDARFDGIFREFVKSSREQLAELKGQAEEVQELTKKCCDMFAEKAKTPAPETLGKLAAFRKDMEEARRQNLLAKVKKEKAEKRRAEQLAKEQAKKEREAAEPKPKPEADGEAGKEQDAAAAESEGKSADSPKSGNSPSKVRTMQVKVPSKPLMVHASAKSSFVSSSLLREALCLATSSSSSSSPSKGPGSSAAPDEGRFSMGPSIGRQSMGPLSQMAGRATLGAPGRHSMGPQSSLGGRMSMGPGSSAMLEALRQELGGDSGGGSSSSTADASTPGPVLPEQGRASMGVPSAGRASLGVPAAGRATLGAPSAGRATLGAPAAGKLSLGADLLKISSSGRLSLGPRSAAALLAAAAEEEASAALRAAGSDPTSETREASAADG
eukprot:TRINITY_DN3358_c0_g1_i2.p1 TRINITY_DN3358_c0_g1~~TRINITY_DN3358_c0_g1_i2.p1  ORF type:complete len:1642 (-),score=572.30 TRINITY_DN3358_c0_g1_i2:3-4904(-)